MLTDINVWTPLWLINTGTFTVKTVLVIGVALLAMKLLPRLSSATRFMVLFYALGASLLLPVLSSALPTWNVFPAWLSPVNGQALEIRPETASRTTGTPNVHPANKVPSGNTTQTKPRSDSNQVLISMTTLLWITWLCGLLFLCSRIFFAMKRIKRLNQQAVDLTDENWLVLLTDGAKLLGLRQIPALRLHPEPIMPMTVGLFRPTILLPVEAEDWTLTRKRDVLLHELAHLKRKDLLYEWISLLPCFLQWFNPLLWQAHRKMIIERERACDDMVLDVGSDPSEYADCLLKTAVEFQAASEFGPSMARQNDLESRLVAILDTKRIRARVTPLAQIGLLTVALGFVIPISTFALQKDQVRDSSTQQVASPSTQDSTNEEIARLRDALSSPNKSRRLEARDELDSLGKSDPVIVELSAALFREYDSDSELFDRLGPGMSGTDDLLGLLDAKFAVDRAAAAQALGQHKDPRVVLGLMRSLEDSNWHVREWSARSLGQIGDPSAVTALVAALNDESSIVREWSARALGDIGSPNAVDGLIQALADSNDEVREWAARSLGDIGSSRALDGLIASLQDTDDDVREWALRSLGDIGDRRATDAIAALINDENADVREWSMRTLAQIQEANHAVR